MKRGDLYKHFKGGEYLFQDIALPLQDSFVNKMHLASFRKVRYHENTHDIELYASNSGAMFIDSDVPYVIYQGKEDCGTDKVWAREIDEFFGVVITPFNVVKRFAKIDKQN